MAKSPTPKNIKKRKPENYQTVFGGSLEISQAREKELQELDRIAKMLVRRDLALSEVSQKREEELLELREKTRELEEEKNKTIAIIANLVDGLLVFDEGNKLSLVNPQAEKNFKVEKEKIMGKSISELNQFPVLNPLINLIGEEMGTIFRKEVKIDEDLILEVTVIPAALGEGKMGFMVILHDVSREKLIERMKTEFVSIAAHQLRTPLSAIKWTLGMLLDGDLGKITKEQKNFIEKTYQSNERMINLINDLLNVTRIEEGKYLYRLVPTEIESVVQFVVNSYKEEATTRKIKLEFKKPEEKLPKAAIDVEKIILVIQNLIDNAVKYATKDDLVKISLKLVKKEIEFSIKDTGVGIPDNQQERVFIKFFRAANAVRLETEGSGLGLYIAKNIIEAHGGKIWFESKEGLGTTFFFTLPAII